MAETSLASLLPAEAADKLIAAHDGDLALLYIYLSRGGAFQAEQAARALCRTLGEIAAAEEKLRRLGLWPEQGAAAPAAAKARQEYLPPEERLPEYSSAELVARAKEDERFSAVLGEAEQVFGHKLSRSDMIMLFGIYDHLALPPEVIFLLLNHCAMLAEARKPGSRPSPRSVEKEAYAWANQEILTLEQAEEYITRQKARWEAVEHAKSALNIFGRDLTPTERKYIASWLDLGFAEDAIAIAYDRTVTNKGSLIWPYMNKILLSWHEKRLHSPAEIEAGDSRRRPGRNAAGSSGSVDLRELDEIFQKI